jgi:hypothetical protein
MAYKSKLGKMMTQIFHTPPQNLKWIQPEPSALPSLGEAVAALESNQMVIKRDLGCEGLQVFMPPGLQIHNGRSSLSPNPSTRKVDDAVNSLTSMWVHTNQSYNHNMDIKPAWTAHPFLFDVVEKGEIRCMMSGGKVVDAVFTKPKVKPGTGDFLFCAVGGSCMPLEQLKSVVHFCR